MSQSSHSITDQIQENFIAYFRLFAGLPGITFVDEGVTWLVNAEGEPGNHILRTRLAGESIDQEIDDTLKRINRLTDHIDWLVFPGCRPTDLGKRLEARGMAGGFAGTWMTADLTSLPSAPPAPIDFVVKQVVNDAMLEEWKQASAAGFGGDVQIFYDAYARHGYGPDAFSLHYTGYQDEQPVTSATLLLSGGIASIYDVSTPPPLRRQGYGSAITTFALHEAIERGYQTAWIWSSDQGKDVYRRLGFVAEDLGVREYPWRSTGH